MQKLELIGQPHLLRYWNILNAVQKQRLQSQIEALNVDIFNQQKSLLQHQKEALKLPIIPLKHCARSGNPALKMKGRELIAAGQCGCILIAGGQGSRLQYDGPKGMFPLTPISKKTLFQLFAEKVAAASQQAKQPLPLAIMTSPSNHEVILNYFKEHAYFQLRPEQLFFFTQSILPLLDDRGNLFLESRDCIAEGPDGNGSTLKCFVEAGIWDKWHNQGIQYVNTVLIDNPLADPFDAELVGFHAATGGDVILKCTPRLHPEEKVGVIAKVGEKIQVVEYSELSDNERLAQLSDGTLKHPFANLSLFSFKMDFIQKAANDFDQMPLHIAYKASKALEAPVMASKFERYIFDVLPFAEQIHLLSYPREYCFAPLKNKEGADSIATVQTALQKLDRLIYTQVTGHSPPSEPFELPQEFYYR